MKGFYDIFCICSWFSGTGGYRACSRSMGDTDGERCVCFWNLHFQLWLIGELFVIVARSVTMVINILLVFIFLLF